MSALIGVCRSVGCERAFVPARLSAHYCSDACAQRERSRRLLVHARLSGVRATIMKCEWCAPVVRLAGSRVRACARCAVRFAQRRSDQRFCCARCRVRASNKRRGDIGPTVRACARCGHGFWSSRKGHIYCSPACRSAAWVERVS